MKRYEPQMDSSETFQGMFQDDAGEWVEFDDMKKAINILSRAKEYLFIAEFGIDHNDVTDLINEIETLETLIQ